MIKFLQRGISPIFAIITVVVIALIAGIGIYSYVYYWQQPAQNNNNTKSSEIVYKNSDYGFELTLPESWKGYSIIKNTWEGREVDGSRVFTGPEILIRNPNWTESKKWQDIPVMVFTGDQWNLVSEGKMAVSAAPIGPQKLGDNGKYVFALPPRWVGFIDALGQADAQSITGTFKAISSGTNPDCKNLWWYDNEHRTCSQKQFCGLYMYFGLRTFQTQTECQSDLNSQE